MLFRLDFRELFGIFAAGDPHVDRSRDRELGRGMYVKVENKISLNY